MLLRLRTIGVKAQNEWCEGSKQYVMSYIIVTIQRYPIYTVHIKP